jgi:hypothetical protein
MFAALHSDVNSLKSGLLHLSGQPYYKKGRSASVKDVIINLILRNYLVDRYSYTECCYAEYSFAEPYYAECHYAECC